MLLIMLILQLFPLPELAAEWTPKGGVGGGSGAVETAWRHMPGEIERAMSQSLSGVRQRRSRRRGDGSSDGLAAAKALSLNVTAQSDALPITALTSKVDPVFQTRGDPTADSFAKALSAPSTTTTSAPPPPTTHTLLALLSLTHQDFVPPPLRNQPLAIPAELMPLEPEVLSPPGGVGSVSVPEPASILIPACALSLILTRRSRRQNTDKLPR